MPKLDPKAEISPAVAVVVIIIVLTVAATLLWYFIFRSPSATTIGQQPAGTIGAATPVTPATVRAPVVTRHWYCQPQRRDLVLNRWA